MEYFKLLRRGLEDNDLEVLVDGRVLSVDESDVDLLLDFLGEVSKQLVVSVLFDGSVV